MHDYCNDVHLTAVCWFIISQHLVINIIVGCQTLTGKWNASGDGLGVLSGSVVGYGKCSLQVPEEGN